MKKWDHYCFPVHNSYVDKLNGCSCFWRSCILILNKLPFRKENCCRLVIFCFYLMTLDLCKMLTILFLIFNEWFRDSYFSPQNLRTMFLEDCFFVYLVCQHQKNGFNLKLHTCKGRPKQLYIIFKQKQLSSHLCQTSIAFSCHFFLG